MSYSRALIILCAGLCWNAAAWGATIWRPADGNTNYVSLAAPDNPTVSFALFDYDEDAHGVNLSARLAFAPGDQISFFKDRDSGIFFAVNDSDPAHPILELGRSDQFAIGANDGSGWVLDDDAPTPMGTNIYALHFVFASGSHALIQVDAKRVATAPAVVPLPAGAWLFVSGLLVLAGRGCRSPGCAAHPARTVAV